MWLGVKEPNYVFERDLKELILSSGHENLKGNNSSEYLIFLILMCLFLQRVYRS